MLHNYVERASITQSVNLAAGVTYELSLVHQGRAGFGTTEILTAYVDGVEVKTENSPAVFDTFAVNFTVGYTASCGKFVLLCILLF